MVIKARCSKNKEWGFLEKYEAYQYWKRGYVKALTSVTIDKELAPAYVYRGGEFIPLEKIDNEVGIDKYIKAKKPFYSKIKEGFIVVLKADVDFVNRVYYPESSSYEIYVLNGNLVPNSDSLPFKKVLDVPKEFDEVVKEPLRILGESFGNREKFLRDRMHLEVVK